MNIITSLGSAAFLIATGAFKEENVFVIANTSIKSKSTLNEVINFYKRYRWNQLSHEQRVELRKFDDADEQFERAIELKAQNAAKAAEICYRLFQNSQVFQYRIIHNPINSDSNPELWYYDLHERTSRLKVASYAPLDFPTLKEYADWQRKNEHGAWLDYLFPNGLTSEKQLMPYVIKIA